MQYREGYGFVANEEEQQEMARLGIGRPPVTEVASQQPIVQEQIQEPVIPVQNEPTFHLSQLSEDEINNRADSYIRTVLGRTEPEKEVAKPIVDIQPKNDDFFGSWIDSSSSSKDEPIQESKQNDYYGNDEMINYRKSIVQAAIKLGKEPDEIERTIASITPEEYVVFASIKAEHENKMKQMRNESARQPIVFNSLKPKPTPTVATAQSSDFNTQSLNSRTVLSNTIKNRFY